MRVCAWPVASSTGPEIARAGEMASRHRGGSVIASCQRVEAVHFHEYDCGAPLRWIGFDALLRLAEVATGLDSIVLGEAQVMGQVRTGLAGAEGSLRRLGAIAISAARELRSETNFDAHTGHLLDRALHIAGVESRGRIAVVGAGAVGRLVAERALELEFEEVVVVARRWPEGEWFDPSRMGFASLVDLASVDAVDVLVTALGSGAEQLRARELPQVRSLAVDLGTPRNLGDELSVPVMTIAAMRADSEARTHGDARRAALREQLRTILARRLEMAERDSRSPVGRLRFEVERLRESEARRIARLHPELGEETVEAITRSLVNQIFHRPTERLRANPDPDLARRLAELFAHEEAL